MVYKLQILSLVNHTHPAATQLFSDAVVRDRSADHWAEILGPDRRQVNESRGICVCDVEMYTLQRRGDFPVRTGLVFTVSIRSAQLPKENSARVPSVDGPFGTTNVK